MIRFCLEESKVNPFIIAKTSPKKGESDTNNNNNDENQENNSDTNNNIRTSFVFELKPDLVMEMVTAAEYLQIPSLLQHVLKMLSAYSEGME